MPVAGKRISSSAGVASNASTLKEVQRHRVLISWALGLVTFVVFLPVAWNEFVDYDDPDYVTSNPHVQSGVTWANVLWALKTGYASNWHPLTWLSHMVDWQIFGDHAGPQHLVSLGFHIVNSLLLFLLLGKMTGALWRSAIVAALFALHPMHVESVAWISERKDVLSAFFWMLTILAYAAYVSKRSGPLTGLAVQSAPGDHRASIREFPALWFYVLSLGAFVLGLMSKPMMVTLPFVLLLLDYWPLGRWRTVIGEGEVPAVKHEPQNAESNLKSNSSALTLVLEKVPFFALSIISSCITFIVQRNGGAVSASLSLRGRVENAAISYVRYLGKMLWPEKLSVLYPHPGHWPLIQIIGAAVLLLLISAMVSFFWRRRPYLPVGWFWFMGTLVPVIGLVQVGVQSMADRYAYIPLIGLFVMLVWGVADVIETQDIQYKNTNLQNQTDGRAAFETKTSKSNPVGLGLFSGPWVKFGSLIAIFALITFAGLTVRQLQYWRDSEALFSHAVEVTKNNYLAYNNLGFYLSHRGKIREAMENYRKSLEINPAYEDALNNMGFALAGQKKAIEAIPYYQAALRVRPNQIEVHNNLGNALADLGEIDQAIGQYKIVLRQKPDHVDAHNNLGIALAMKGQLEEAIGHFREAIRHKPNDSGAHSNLGNALAVQRKFKEAIQEYQECLRLRPDDAQANNNLANVLAEQGLLAEATAHYERAIQLNKDNPEAHYNLAMALVRQGSRPEAIAHLKEAIRLKPDYEQARQQLDRIIKAE